MRICTTILWRLDEEMTCPVSTTQGERLCSSCSHAVLLKYLLHITVDVHRLSEAPMQPYVSLQDDTRKGYTVLPAYEGRRMVIPYHKGCRITCTNVRPLSYSLTHQSSQEVMIGQCRHEGVIHEELLHKYASLNRLNTFCERTKKLQESVLRGTLV